MTQELEKYNQNLQELENNLIQKSIESDLKKQHEREMIYYWSCSMRIRETFRKLMNLKVN